MRDNSLAREDGSGPLVAPGREQISTIFSALSDPTRMETFCEILRRGDVGSAEFDERFPISTSTISHHTTILSAAGLIDTRRAGRFFFYRRSVARLEVEVPHFAQLLRELV
jgi:DNA-binding transcriptional ArsR family regulator